MTQYRNGFEGISSGTTMTVANSGGTSGPAFTQVVKGATSTLAASNTNASHGSISLNAAPASGEANYWAWRITSEASAEWAANCYIKAAAGPTAEDYIMQWRGDATGSSVSSTLRVTTGGYLKMLNFNGSVTVTQTGTTIPWALATSIRIEGRVNCGTTTTNGTFSADWYLGNSTTSQGHIDQTMAPSGQWNANPTVNHTQVRYGRAAAVTGTWPAFWDSCGLDTAATGYLGPVPSNPPTAVVDQALVSRIDFKTGSTPNTPGNALSFSILQTVGPTVTAVESQEGVFLVEPDPTVPLEYEITTAETGGSTAVTTVTVAPLSSSGAPGNAQVVQMVGGALV